MKLYTVDLFFYCIRYFNGMVVLNDKWDPNQDSEFRMAFEIFQKYLYTSIKRC